MIKGNKFFDTKTGDEFFVKGVAYQPRKGGLYDPLSLPNDCLRDAKVMNSLGINTIRVYETYPSKNHDECVKHFEQHGIYMILDLPNYDVSINRNSPTYDTRILNHFKETVDTFSKYDNTLAYISGNEVANDEKTTESAAFVKATLRDIKEYIRTNQKRLIPVGYANNDDPKTRLNIQNYFNCGNNTNESNADFFGINIYEWCGDSNFEESGYKDRTKEFENYSIPVLLTEFGCNTIKPRIFGDVSALYGPLMKDVFSGGIAYEYSNEVNQYGLVEVTKNSSNIKILEDGKALMEQFNKIQPTKPTQNLKTYIPKNKSPESCPQLNNNWNANINLPPKPEAKICDCIMSNMECVLTQSKEGDKIGDTMKEVCSKNPEFCEDIVSDGKNGVYGMYSFCETNIKASIVFNNAYMKSSECDFNGLAKLTKPFNKNCETLRNSVINKTNVTKMNLIETPSKILNQPFEEKTEHPNKKQKSYSKKCKKPSF